MKITVTHLVYLSIFLFVVYQMGRLCGGAHEISGIKVPLFLCGGMGEWWGGDGWVGCGGCGGVGHAGVDGVVGWVVV